MESKKQALSASGVLVAIGIIFGDIGTSPLYVFNAVLTQKVVSRDLILGTLSCIFWTLTLITSVKYIYLALRADNRGHGGIFALYALVRKKAKWIIFPAIIGCCTLLADGFITPAISISAAVEGLWIYNKAFPTTYVVVVIVIFIFLFQQLGATRVSKTFGVIMSIWFISMGLFGALAWWDTKEIFAALNPVYAYNLLTHYPGGFWLLGVVFLCTTGAEALYSDLNQGGRNNIRVSWGLVKICLVSSYFGQGAWLLQHEGELITQNPFYMIIPEALLPYAIGLAILAAIIASQSLISGIFGMINEAMKLKLWPNSEVRYPSRYQGQIYIPSINWILLFGCLIAILIFRESSGMEAAYGSAIILNMLMTTILLVYYSRLKNRALWSTISFAIFFFTLEFLFFVSNLNKFPQGGWFTHLFALLFFTMMFIFYKARMLRQKHTDLVDLKDYVDLIKKLQADTGVPKEASHLVYMALGSSKRHIDSNIIYSIFKKKPKRADVYWFLHIDTVSGPFTSKYSVDTIIPQKCFFVRIKLGFKADYRVSSLFNHIIHEMAENGEVDLLSPYPSLRKYNMIADFKFIILHSWASVDNNISVFQNFIIQGYRLIKSISLPAEEQYGLELANVEIEKVPIMIGPSLKANIRREDNEREREKERKYHDDN